MVFNVRHYRDEGVHDESGRELVPPVSFWGWSLVRADDSVVCRSGSLFESEREARSDIASAKKSMKGAMRCKVVTDDASA